MFHRKFVVFVVSKSNCAITLNRWTEFNRHCQFVFSLKDLTLSLSFDHLTLCVVRKSLAQLAFCELTATDSQQTEFLTLIFRAGAEQRVAAPAAGGHRQGVWLAVGGSRGNRRCHGGGRKWCAGSWATLTRTSQLNVCRRWGRDEEQHSMCSNLHSW